jgi:hypothetical protein
VIGLLALRTCCLYHTGNIPGTHCCWRLSRLQSYSAAGRIMSMENSNDTIGNRTRDLPTCSAVPQPTLPLYAQSKPDIAPPLFGAHGSLSIEIPYFTAFLLTATLVITPQIRCIRQRRLPREIRDSGTCCWWRLHNVELRYLYC